MKDLSLIWGNLWRKPLRTSLLLISIMIAFVLFTAMGAVLYAYNGSVDVLAANRLVVFNKINLTQPLPLAYVNRVVDIDGVDAVSYATWFGGYYREQRNFLPMFAVDPETWLDAYPEWIIPAEERARFLNTRNGVLMGEATARAFEWSVGDRIPIQSSIWRNQDGGNTWEVEVVGIYTGADELTDTGNIVMHYEYFDESRRSGQDTIGWIAVTTEDVTRNEAVMTAIDEQFKNSRWETKTDTEQAFTKSFSEQLGDINFILTGVMAAAFATILLIVGNTMIMVVRERTQEIGVLKTLGFSSSRIMRQVLGESLLLALGGGLAGILLGWLAVILGKGELARVLPNLVMPGFVWSYGVLIMVALGVITGAAPAIGAMRLRIVAALGKG